MKKIIEIILDKTDLSMEQKTIVRGRIRIFKEDLMSILTRITLATSLVFAFVLYFKNIEQAIFWAIISVSVIGYKICCSKQKT